MLLGGWLIKLSVSLIFLLIFAHYYGNGSIYGDVGNFIHDGKILAEYGKVDPFGYFQLLFGINTNDIQLLQTHLADTHIWSYADNGDFINDNRLIIRLNSLIHFISFGNYYVHFLIFSFLSFIGVMLLYKTFQKWIMHQNLFYFALLLTPTFSFWGSGLTKESLFVVGVGLFFYSLQLLLTGKRTLRNRLLLLTGILLLLFNKPHIGLILLPLSIIPILGYTKRFTKIRAGMIGAGILLGFFILSFTPDRINIVSRISQKQSDLVNVGQGGIFFINDSAFCAFDYQQLDHFDYNRESSTIQVKKATEGEYKLFGRDDFHRFTISPSDQAYDVYLVIEPSGSFVKVPMVNYSLLQLIKNTPIALFNVMVRPLPTDGGSDFKYLIFIENILFIVFLAFCLFKRKELSMEEKSWVFYLGVAAFLLILIIGWTTPILGAIVRYKMAAQLFLLILAFIILKKNPIRS